jgi:hypothetical protein
MFTLTQPKPIKVREVAGAYLVASPIRAEWLVYGHRPQTGLGLPLNEPMFRVPGDASDEAVAIALEAYKAGKSMGEQIGAERLRNDLKRLLNIPLMFSHG